MNRITIDFEEIAPSSFLALNKERKIMAYSYSIERVLDLSGAAGEFNPWIVKASTYPGYPLYVGKVNMDGKAYLKIIDEKQKEGLLKLIKIIKDRVRY